MIIIFLDFLYPGNHQNQQYTEVKRDGLTLISNNSCEINIFCWKYPIFGVIHWCKWDFDSKFLSLKLEILNSIWLQFQEKWQFFTKNVTFDLCRALVVTLTLHISKLTLWNQFPLWHFYSDSAPTIKSGSIFLITCDHTNCIR